MSNIATRILPEALRSIAFGSISGTYARVGTALLHPSRQMHFANTTDVLLTVSIDGVNDYDVVTPFTNYVLDFNTNRSNNSGSSEMAQGTQWYVKGLPSEGSLYIATYYGSNF